MDRSILDLGHSNVSSILVYISRIVIHVESLIALQVLTVHSRTWSLFLEHELSGESLKWEFIILIGLTPLHPPQHLQEMAASSIVHSAISSTTTKATANLLSEHMHPLPQPKDPREHPGGLLRACLHLASSSLKNIVLRSHPQQHWTLPSGLVDQHALLSVSTLLLFNPESTSRQKVDN